MDDGDGGLLPLFARSAPVGRRYLLASIHLILQLLLMIIALLSAEQDDGLEEKLRRAREENRRLAATLGAILADHPHLRSLATPPPVSAIAATAANVSSREEIVSVTAEPQAKIRTVCARADPSDSDSNLSVKDGYQWRKYGQKVTRDNPHPRGYFRCAFAPSCPVKKKVQRDAEDTSMLVATYEGEHNHARSPAGESVVGDESTAQAGSQLPCSISVNSSGRRVALDPTSQPGPPSSVEAVSREVVTPEFQKRLVVEMVNWLVNDAEFMRALTDAVAEKILEKFPDRLS